ncbi:type II toxin-antitoxin system RelE/ParE family toxin [Cysteiniphilum sp. 6C5]|uniref:type II toxin-antitoxin system RelE/ParE family toxin n=1 Tax=unclassified Cysteiniphilum TaxID=2610889 RepID=UPI003F869FAE
MNYKYKVELEVEVIKYLKALSKSELIKAYKVIDLLRMFGHALSLPYKKDIQGNKHLKELRTPTGTRIYYFYFDGKTYRCIWAGNKKTQTKDIEKAKRILKDLIGG